MEDPYCDMGAMPHDGWVALGHHRHTNVTTIYTTHGTTHTRPVVVRSVRNRWNVHHIEGFKATPWRAVVIPDVRDTFAEPIAKGQAKATSVEAPG